MTTKSGGDLMEQVLVSARAAGLPSYLAERVARFTPLTRPAAAGRALVACDVDRTLVYSSKALGLPGADRDAPRLVVGEVYLGVPAAFYTRDAEQLLVALAAESTFVPTTTRTRAQFARIRLPVEPRYAITSNGGHLLVDGTPDRDWSAHVTAILAGISAPLAEVTWHLQKVADPLWTRAQRVAEELFVYLVVERSELPATFLDELSGWCAERAWTVSLQGRKLYCVPSPLTKSAAITEVAWRAGTARTVAAGDSLLDADLLASAEEGVRPAHGELHDRRWLLPHLTVTERSGVLGGEEVVARLLASVLAGRPL